MSFFNQGTEVYPHELDVVFTAVMKSVSDCRYGIVTADRVTGFLLIQTNNSERHWNGQLSVSILQLGDNTQVSISGPLSNGSFFSSNASVGAMALSRTRLERAIKSVLNATPISPVNLPSPEPDRVGKSVSASVADEIAKLKHLLNDGAITEVEYKSLKKKIIDI